MSGLFNINSKIKATLTTLASSIGASLLGYQPATGGIITVQSELLSLDSAAAMPLSIYRTCAEVAAAWQSGTGISIAFEGDSLTYGQQVGGPTAAINGSAILRASYQMPESFKDAMTYAKGSKAWGAFTVTNRGYPGDNTANGITRWAASPVVDMVFIMYGTNDSNGNPLSAATYRANMSTLISRRLAQGSAVVVLGPPSIDSNTADPAVKRYSGIAREVAERFGLVFVDQANQLADWATPARMWTDGTHLTGEAYRALGMGLAGLICGPASNLLQVQDGTVITYDSGGNISPDALGFTFAESTSGHLWQLNQNVNLCFAVDVQEPVQVVIYCTNTSANSQVGAALFNGGASDFDNGTSEFYGTTASNGNGTVQYIAGILRPGKRFFVLTNPNVNSIYIESVRFVKISSGLQIAGVSTFKPNISGLMRPIITTASGYWSAIDISKNLPAYAWSFDAMLTINSTSSAGICVQTTKAKRFDYLTNNAVWLTRVGTVLRLTEFINGTPTNYDTAAVFTTGVDWTGILAMKYDGTSILCYVDGVLKYTKATPTFTSGYPGIFSDSAGKFVCLSAVCTHAL